MILAFTILTYFHVVMGEIVPKSFTLQHSERVALAVAHPITIFRTIFRPFIWVLVGSSSAVLRWFGLPPPSGISLVHSEEELKMLVTASRQKGVLEEEEQEMLHKVFEFADKDAEDVMVPRPDVVALPSGHAGCGAAARSCSSTRTRATRCSRAGSTTSSECSTFATCSVRCNERGLERTDVRAILRPAIMVPETKPLDELLAEFRRTSNHMAIVVDEYGSVAGLATLEDLLEEIVGEIGDEFDLPDAGILRIGRGRVRIGGSFPIEEFNERFGTNSRTRTTTRWAGSSSASWDARRGWATRSGFEGARFEVVGVEGSRITEVDVDLDQGRAGARAG